MLIRRTHIRTISLSGLLMLACAPSKPNIEIPTPTKISNPNLVGFSAGQRTAIESLYETLSDLEPLPVKIPADIYERRARFEKLYGLPFSGPFLTQWLNVHIKTLKRHEDWTIAVNLKNGVVGIGAQFFELPTLDQMYLLVHEAAHSVPGAPAHVNCGPKNVSISVYQPEFDLHDNPACDRSLSGAYSFQAAFLFELYARGLVNPKRAGLLYNTTLTRIEKGE